MSEDIETTDIDESAEDVVTPANFSFYDMMAGVSYPKDVITISLDEAAAYDAAKIVEDFEKTDVSSLTPTQAKKAAKDFEARIAEVTERVSRKSATFHLTGVSSDLVESAKESVDDMFMDKRRQRKLADGSLQKYLPEDQMQPYMRMLNATIYALYIEKVVYNENGVTFVAPDPDMIAHFYDTAPDGAKAKLSEGIQKLRVEAGQYESYLDEGFFQKS